MGPADEQPHWCQQQLLATRGLLQQDRPAAQALRRCWLLQLQAAE